MRLVTYQGCTCGDYEEGCVICSAKESILDAIKKNYNPDKTSIEISGLLDYFKISDKEFKKFANCEVNDESRG